MRLILLITAISAIKSSKLPEKCGTNGLIFNEFRIIGGQKTEPGEWPWQVALKRWTDVNGVTQSAFCGGTLINENWILTAAHCVHKDPNTKSYTVYLGSNDLSKLTGNVVNNSVEKIVKHEQWNYDLKQYDIALVKMHETIDFVNRHKFLHPICLPKIANELKDKCYATGFGYQDQNGSTTMALMKVSEPVYDISKCYVKMNSIDKETNLCAGGSGNGGLGTCNGDSGGPLQCQSSDGKWYQIGITSWGEPCAHAGVPDVFTRVAYFRNWIESVLEKN